MKALTGHTIQPAGDAAVQRRQPERAVVKDGGVEGRQGERRAQAPFRVLPDPEELELAGE